MLPLAMLDTENKEPQNKVTEEGVYTFFFFEVSVYKSK